MHTIQSPTSIQIQTTLKILYGLSITEFSLSPFSVEWSSLYATVGFHTCLIFIQKNNQLHKLFQIDLKQGTSISFEDLYTCCWIQTTTSKGNCLCLAVGGRGQVIYLLDVIGRKIIHETFAHGRSIYQLKAHPKEPDLLLSCSEDLSIKLWKATQDSMQCLYIFAGESGHKGPVLSVDFDPTGQFFASSGMDYFCKVWSIPKERDVDCLVIQRPAYSSNTIFKEYIDCIKWLGSQLIICKGINGKLRIVTFSPKTTNAEVLCDLCYPISTSLWYFRFSVDPISKRLAVGSDHGKIFVFDLNQAANLSMIYPQYQFKITLDRKKNRDIRANVRDLHIFDSKIVCIHEDGHVFFVDLAQEQQPQEDS